MNAYGLVAHAFEGHSITNRTTEDYRHTMARTYHKRTAARSVVLVYRYLHIDARDSFNVDDKQRYLDIELVSDRVSE